MDIIQFPKIVNNYTSYWSIYEKSYKDNNYLYEYKLNNNNFNNYNNEFNKIVKIKNNFYRRNEDVVLSILFRKLNNLYTSKYNDYFKDNIIKFIETEKINDFMYCFLKTLRYDENRVLLLTNNFPDDNFMNDLKKINQVILEISKLDNMDKVINNIYCNSSISISMRFEEFVKETDLYVLSSLFKKVNFLKKFYNEFSAYICPVKINTIILHKIIGSLNNNSISNIKLANNIINLFNFLLTKHYITIKIENMDYNLLLDYLNASIYYWILENNYINIKILIKYSYMYLPKLDFLEYYKIHLQNRSMIIRNYEIENKCFNKITEIFQDDELSKLIYDLKKNYLI